MQTISLGNPFINLKGEWKEDVEYEYLDAVTSRGSLFIANKKFIPAGTEPSKSNAWLLSARGADEEIEKELIRNILSEHETLSTKDGAHDFPEYKEGQLLTVKQGELAFTNDYRIPITKSTTWYVRTDGDDANDGSADTPEKAFKTIQGCFNYIYSHFVQSHGDVIIRIGEGEFNGFELNGTHMGIHHILMYGAGIDKTIITNKANKGCVAVGSYKRVSLQNIKFLFDDSTIKASTNIIFSDIYSYVTLTNCLIEINETLGTSIIRGTFASNNSSLRLNTNNEFIIKSTVTNSKVQIVVLNIKSVMMMQNTITVNGKAQIFINISDLSYFYCPKATNFVGTMTGTRYIGALTSVINTMGKGTNAFPGNANGTLATGATYY